MNLSVKQKQTHRHRRQMYGYQTGKWGDDRQARSLGLADIKITKYKIKSYCAAQKPVHNKLQ